MKTQDTELLVLGGGVAGMAAALRAHAAGAHVTLACKTPLMGGSTRWAQGGVAAPALATDRAAHAGDTVRAGRGLCEPETVAAFVAEAQVEVDALRDLGVPFSAQFTLEGGHSRPRIRHTGDATGHAISAALTGALRAAQGQRLHLREDTFARNLRVQGGRVVGADLLTREGPLRVRAGAVLLATGGFGGLYPVTTAPPETTGDGLALAFRAGAALRDLEFVQFHPTAVVSGGRAQLVTEAARGEGGQLVNAHGTRFMARYDDALELAPRDVVARASAAERAATGAVYLDLRPLGEAFVLARFPTVAAALATQGLHLGRDLIPVQPAVHYTVGGVLTDAHGRTTLAGLYAAGEVASSGLHGANRLASNSLSEGLVFGARAVCAALSAPAGLPQHGEAAPTPVAEPACTGALRTRVAHAAGLLRNAEGLRAALTALTPPPRPNAVPESWAALEAANLELLARLVVQAALAREESRGGHARTDFPHEAVPAVHTVQAWSEGQDGAALEHVLVGAGVLGSGA